MNFLLLAAWAAPVILKASSGLLWMHFKHTPRPSEVRGEDLSHSLQLPILASILEGYLYRRKAGMNL